MGGARTRYVTHEYSIRLHIVTAHQTQEIRLISTQDCHTCIYSDQSEVTV